MKYIAFDCSGEALLVICNNGEKSESVYLADCQLQHSLTLLKSIEDCLEKLNTSINEIDLVCAVVGPGSFTGIRIGVATAKGFCDANPKLKALALTSFDVIAYAENGKRLAIIDAHHDNFYVAGYEGEKICLEPSFLTKEQLLKIDGFKLLSSTKIDGLDTVVVDVVRGLENAMKIKADFCGSSAELKPFYCRLSQAEEGRK